MHTARYPTSGCESLFHSILQNMLLSLQMLILDFGGSTVRSSTWGIHSAHLSLSLSVTLLMQIKNAKN